jgi:hypothetical protein
MRNNTDRPHRPLYVKEDDLLPEKSKDLKKGGHKRPRNKSVSFRPVKETLWDEHVAVLTKSGIDANENDRQAMRRLR